MRKQWLGLICGAVLTGFAANAPAAGVTGPVRLLTLDPGHFHAALVQKYMYEGVDPQVHVYAPKGDDVVRNLSRASAEFLKRVQRRHAAADRNARRFFARHAPLQDQDAVIARR